MNIAGFHTGYSGPGVKTVLPARASALLDFRLVPDQRPDEVLDLVRSHLDRREFVDVEITVVARAEPAATSPDDPFVARCVSVAERITDSKASIDPMVAGSLPCVASLDRHVGCAAHAPNEHIRLQDIAPAVRYLIALLAELGSSEVEAA